MPKPYKAQKRVNGLIPAAPIGHTRLIYPGPSDEYDTPYVLEKTAPGKWRLQHRLIIERELGRSLDRNEIVHHKDGDGTNNERSNLELMSRSEHMTLHKKVYKGQSCYVAGCARPAFCRRMCSPHYQQEYRAKRTADGMTVGAFNVKDETGEARLERTQKQAKNRMSNTPRSKQLHPDSPLKKRGT